MRNFAYRVILLSVLVAAAVCARSLASGSYAQQPDLFEVVIPATTLNLPINQNVAEMNTLGKALARMSVYANGALCTSADLTTATRDVVLTLGLSGQPAACNLDGAKVTFADGRCSVLVTGMVLLKGTRATLINLAPYPPHGAPPPPSGCVPVPVAAPLPAPSPQPLPAGGIPPPPMLNPSPVQPSLPVLRPPDTGDAGLAALL